MEWILGWGVGGSKVSQILGITATIASLDTYAGSIKSVRMVNLRRRLNGDGWVGGRGSRVSKVSQILGIINTIACFDTYEVVSKVANVSRW